MAAFGLALVMPFHKLSRLALSCGDSVYFCLPSELLLLLPYENPLEWGRGRLAGGGDVGVVGPWSMLMM